MSSFLNRKIFKGLICLHILHHADESPVYGSWLLEELSTHGYKISPGTLYPMLHYMAKEGLLEHYEENVGGKIRKYYVTTEMGKKEFYKAKKYVLELAHEIGIEEI